MPRSWMVLAKIDNQAVAVTTNEQLLFHAALSIMLPENILSTETSCFSLLLFGVRPFEHHSILTYLRDTASKR